MTKITPQPVASKVDALMLTCGALGEQLKMDGFPRMLGTVCPNMLAKRMYIQYVDAIRDTNEAQHITKKQKVDRGNKCCQGATTAPAHIT